MDINKIKPEWFEMQIKAGRDLKHIADYLQAPKWQIKEMLNLYGLSTERPVKDPLKIIEFEDIVINDLVFRAGSQYTVIKRTKTQLTIKKNDKYNKEIIKLTKAKWEKEKWKVKRDYEPPVTYNLNDTPEGKKQLEQLRASKSATDIFKTSRDMAMNTSRRVNHGSEKNTGN